MAAAKNKKADYLVYSDADYSEKPEGVVVYDARSEKDAIAKYLRKVRGDEAKPEVGEAFSVRAFVSGDSSWFKIKTARRSVAFEVEDF